MTDPSIKDIIKTPFVIIGTIVGSVAIVKCVGIEEYTGIVILVCILLYLIMCIAYYEYWCVCTDEGNDFCQGFKDFLEKHPNIAPGKAINLYRQELEEQELHEDDEAEQSEDNIADLPQDKGLESEPVEPEPHTDEPQMNA